MATKSGQWFERARCRLGRFDNRTYVRYDGSPTQEDDLKQATRADSIADALSTDALSTDALAPDALAPDASTGVPVEAPTTGRAAALDDLRALIGPSVVEPQSGLFDVASLWGPGQLLGLVGAPGLGMTQVGIAQLAAIPGPLAWVESSQWFSPEAAWEGGISDERMVVVRSTDKANWAEATAALMDGMAAVCADVPARIHDNVLRRLSARARARRARLILRSRGPLPTGIVHSVITAEAVEWVGAGQGRGRLLHRQVVATATGKGVKGPAIKLGFEDDGTNFVCVVSGLGAAASGRHSTSWAG